MKYHSTRSEKAYFDSRDAILKGLCDDGGLFVTDDMDGEKLDPGALIDKEYRELAFDIMKRFLSDMDEKSLKDAIASAYDDKFASRLITPVTPLGND